jgi:hypothetical protein
MRKSHEIGMYLLKLVFHIDLIILFVCKNQCGNDCVYEKES